MLYHSINGQFQVAQDQAAVGLRDRGLAYGHGLFESLYFHQGELPLKQRHVQRLCTDALTLGICLNPTQIGAYLDSFLADLRAVPVNQGVVKLIVTAGAGGRGYQSPSSLSPLVICQYAQFDATEARAQRQQGIKLWRCSYRLPLNPALAGIKHLNRLDQVLARREWSSAEYADGLMLSADGLVIEATAANLFARTDRGWVTPALDMAGVAGVMRALLQEDLFVAAAMPLAVESLSLGDLERASEIFLCNSVRGIVPVTQIAGSGSASAVNKLIGEQTKMLQSRLSQQYSCFL